MGWLFYFRKIFPRMSRLIGQYTGTTRGALVLVFGAIHGNETAGPQALKEVFRMLKREPLVNPGFEFKGRLVGFTGNLQAYKAGQRFLQHDLNRSTGQHFTISLRVLPLAIKNMFPRFSWLRSTKYAIIF